MVKGKIQAHIIGGTVSSNDSKAHQLYDKSRLGEKVKGKIQYSLVEALFLVHKKKLEILSKNKILTEKELTKKFQRSDKRFLIKYQVFEDLREKGYIVKTALKFGADFRVYEKGKKPGQTHAKWVVFADSERGKLTWQEFSAKNRVAHSTKKNLLIAIVDEEGSVSYYEVGWIKP